MNCQVCKKPSGTDWLCERCQQLSDNGWNLLDVGTFVSYQDGKVAAKDWLDSWPNALAVAFAVAKPKLPKHQIRMFYGHVKRLQAQLRSRGVFDDDIQEGILQMKPRAHAQLARGRIPAEFKRFIDLNVDRADNAERFERFVQHFESLIAYCEGRLRDN